MNTTPEAVAVLVIGGDEAETIALSDRVRDLRPDLVFGHADTLAEARLIFADSLPDVVMLDLTVPNGKGLASVRELRQKIDKTTQLVVLTALQDEPISEYFSSGADAFLEKTSSPRQIAATLYKAKLTGATSRRKSRQWQTLSMAASQIDKLAGKLCPAEAAN